MDSPEKSLKETIVERMDRQDNKLMLATSIIELAKKGDKASLNLVGKLLEEKTTSDIEKLFPLTDEQFKAVICLAADRIRGVTRAN